MVSDDDNNKIPMAECGSCRAIVPLDSEECAECGVSFSGVSDEALGECAACQALVPIDSKSCPKCGVYFVADDVVDVLRQWLLNTGIELESLFSKIDVDGDGQINSEELKDSLLKLNLADLPPSQIDRLIAQFDSNSDGLISYSELVFTITGEEVEESQDLTSKPKEFSENVLTRVMEKYSITDRESFLTHAENFDENDNGYLTEGELKKAAEQFSDSESIEDKSEGSDEDSIVEESEPETQVEEESEPESQDEDESNEDTGDSEESSEDDDTVEDIDEELESTVDESDSNEKIEEQEDITGILHQSNLLLKTHIQESLEKKKNQ